MTTAHSTGQPAPTELDALVVGAGFAGLYTLHCLRDKLGLSVQVCEAGSDVGGTWYWNRYPGARCDSESAYYMFTDHLSKDILQEWTWSERYARQPEILAYLRFVAERMDLRRDIRFDTRVSRAVFDQAAGRWDITTDAGARLSARFLITGVGCLSKPFKPKLPGLEHFSGQCCHTAEWPEGGIDFTGKRVAVIGTGATAVQVVPEIAPQVKHLFVFQRTPSHDLPGRNYPLDDAAAADIKARYDETWRLARSSFAGFPLENPQTSALEVSPEERRRRYDAAWDQGGLGFGFGTFGDLLISKEANDTAVEYLAGRIAQIVHDPQVAERLTARYPFFTKRPPLEHGYYETFNRPNVTLVDVRQSPIEAVTANAIRTRDAEYPVDCIVLATGFDAMTGALFDIDIRGRDGLALKDKWKDGPRTYLGLTAVGFPNLFMISGPQSPSVLTNMPVSIEQHVEWIADCIAYMNRHDIDSIEPTTQAEQGWLAHHQEVSNATLIPQTDSWWVGANVPGKQRLLYPYPGGLDVYRKICNDVAAAGYEGFSRTPAPA